MPYYIRVLGTEPAEPSLDQLREKAAPALIENLAPETAPWMELVLKHPSGEEIALIERSETNGGMGADELAEFIREVKECKPTSASHWLQSYLPQVKVIYAFQVLPGTEFQDGWEKIHAVHSFIWNQAKGIIQSDGEGFTNEDGYTIVWQFGPNADGRWNAAVLNGSEQWITFEMDLGDHAQRELFQRGEVPSGAILLEDN